MRVDHFLSKRFARGWLPQWAVLSIVLLSAGLSAPAADAQDYFASGQLRAAKPSNFRCAARIHFDVFVDAPEAFLSASSRNPFLIGLLAKAKSECPDANRVFVHGKYRNFDLGHAEAMFGPGDAKLVFDADIDYKPDQTPFFFEFPGSLGSILGWEKTYGGSGFGGRYSTPSEYLTGKTYLYFPYTAEELNLGLGGRPLPPERQPVAAITLTKDGAEYLVASSTARIPYESKAGSPAPLSRLSNPDVQCFSAEPLGHDACVFPVLTLSQAPEKHFLAMYKSTGPKSWMVIAVGYLREVTLEEARAAMGRSDKFASAADAANRAAVAAGKPKPAPDFEVLPVIWRPLADGIYNNRTGPFDNEDTAKLNRMTLFVTFQQAYSEVCMEQLGIEGETYVHDAVRWTGSKTRWPYAGHSVTTQFFEKYEFAREEIRPAYMQLYGELGNLSVSEAFRIGGGGDVAVLNYLVNLAYRGGQLRAGLAEFMAREGCNSPTLAQFDANLLDRAKQIAPRGL